MEWLQAVERNVKAKVKKIQGVDTDGSEYTSLGQLWRKVLRPAANGSNSSEEDPNGLWYTKANEYWDAESNCPCTDGEPLPPRPSFALGNSLLIRLQMDD